MEETQQVINALLARQDEMLLLLKTSTANTKIWSIFSLFLGGAIVIFTNIALENHKNKQDRRNKAMEQAMDACIQYISQAYKLMHELRVAISTGFGANIPFSAAIELYGINDRLELLMPNDLGQAFKNITHLFTKLTKAGYDYGNFGKVTSDLNDKLNLLIEELQVYFKDYNAGQIKPWDGPINVEKWKIFSKKF